LSQYQKKKLGLDLKDFYLNIPMDYPEYLKMKRGNFLDDVTTHYNSSERITKECFVFCKICQGMYSFTQVGLIAQQLLGKRLEYRYHQSGKTPGFWKHYTRPISFTLRVDDFGVNYVCKEHADHLIKVTKEHYKVAEDCEGTKYCGITLDWDYIKHQVHLSRLGYCDKALTRFLSQASKNNVLSP